MKSDLLEHEDFTVGLMTSQILTEVHAIDPLRLEECIQECPAGTILSLCILLNVPLYCIPLTVLMFSFHHPLVFLLLPFCISLIIPLYYPSVLSSGTILLYSCV